MTTTSPAVPDAADGETRRLAGQLLATGHAETWESALGMAQAELADEQERRRAGEEQARAFAASFVSMTACPACGAAALGRSTGFCDPCSATAGLLEAEASAEELVPGGKRRRDLVAKVLEQRRAG